MNYLLSNLDKVREVVLSQPFGLITDIDGTIAELAPTAEAVRVDSGCARQLKSLVSRLPIVAAISGRLAKVARNIVGVDGIVYYGNHGLERWSEGKVEIKPSAQDYVAKTTEVIRELSPLLLPLGVVFEDKGAGLVFHYRALPNREEVMGIILKELSRSHAAREFNVDKARAVIELRPPLKVTKGTVLKEVIEDYHLRAAIYMGDDVSDIDAFNIMRTLSDSETFQGLAVGVIGDETPPEVTKRADLFLQGIREVETFLSWLDETIPADSHLA